MKQRASGILMHISSLPGDYGIGTLGQDAMHFIDFLHRAGQRYWQLLPLVPTGMGNSPYMSVSVFAGNPLLIDLEQLVQDGLLTWDEVNRQRYYAPDRADFAWLQANRPTLLRLAYSRADASLRQTARSFAKEQSDWLPDYCLFMAAKEHFGGVDLIHWPDKALLRREPDAIAQYTALLEDEIGYHGFVQYLFFHQWQKVKAYAHQQGVSIIGDLPIYVSGDSADVWVHPEIFLMDEDRVPAFVAGVPADSFSADGQRWGNPLYNWEAQEKTDFAWWCSRVRHCLEFYDVMRFDHFRGFDTYWAVPAESPTALVGEWRKGPGMKLINALRRQVPEAEYIAEDLGLLNQSARDFVQESGLPGMRVLVDAFDPSGASSFLPHCCPENAVMYTGTHDTATFVQWLFDHASWEERTFAMRYLRLREDEGWGWGAVCGVWASPCKLAVAPLQDVLGLGGDARMNAPGTSGGQNWGWRVRREAINDQVADRLREVTQTYCRLAPEPAPELEDDQPDSEAE